MRMLSKIAVTSFLFSIPFVAPACKSAETDGEGGADGSETGGKASTGGKTGAGGTGGKNGSGGKTSSSGGDGGALGGEGNVGGAKASGGTESSGGTDNGTGGSTPVEKCDYEDGDKSCFLACVAEDGPTDLLKNSGAGAFAESASWTDGWTNWSLDSNAKVEDGEPDEVIDADITADLTLTADKVWGIKNVVHVTEGATLTIEPGTIIKGDGPTKGVLVISRGGKINAVGTAKKPIIFTSPKDNGSKAAGDWGGLILLGKASNFKGGDVLIEGLASDALNQYGPGGADGTVDDHDDESSGELKYVIIEFSGIELSEGKEVNGLTMGSVGSGTKISYIQVNTTLDDCFEWFGGKVDTSHLVCNNGGDDMFDVDQGYRGEITNAFGRQIGASSTDPNGLEWDSDLGGLTPVTSSLLTNATLCGTGEIGAPNYGMVLRENITGALDGLVVMGFDAFADTRDAFGSEEEPHVTVANTTAYRMYDNTIDLDDVLSLDNDAGFDETAWFEAGDNNALIVD